MVPAAYSDALSAFAARQRLQSAPACRGGRASRSGRSRSFAMSVDQELAEYRCKCEFEKQFLPEGTILVAGCDEAGRGSLFGPLFAAAVILDPAQPIPGVDDSKKLTPKKREMLSKAIIAKAVAYRIVSVSAAEVDSLNVYEASRQAMIRALLALDPAPQFVLTDAMPLEREGDAGPFPVPYKSIVHGDAKSASIAAASILAKVARDQEMSQLDLMYPQYRLAANKGYGTKEHLDALALHGPCPLHRTTYQPVKDMLLPHFPNTKIQ
jgi:ribonuclease HII